ncbi:MAG TPA: hypothetical protein VFS97_15265 [Nitrososphaeraceae archaeon]|nr:hypothetical protein [Nitrososphaeraceae archaeon]
MTDMFSATESKSGTRTPHEYIRDTISFRFRDCKFCGARTELTCIKCGYCYSCHWKKEKEEKRILDSTLNEIFSLSPSSTRKNTLIVKDARESSLPPQHQQQIIVDVHGRTSEPICTYYRCNHKFSVHSQGSNACKCKHPTNKAHGVSLRVLLFLYTTPFLLLHNFYQIFGS